MRVKSGSLPFTNKEEMIFLSQPLTPAAVTSDCHVTEYGSFGLSHVWNLHDFTNRTERTLEQNQRYFSVFCISC